MRVGRSWVARQYWRWGAIAGAVAAALAFDAVTPQLVSVGLFYVAIVLIGFWFPNPKAALFLALFATPLIIVGYWITNPDSTPAWEAWLNRALAIGTVWLTAVFVWRIRVLAQKLQFQIDIANDLSGEMDHRIGNHLQLVASYLRLEANRSGSKESRRILELAASRVMAIGNIQRMVSHSTPSHMIDTKSFITALIREMSSALPDPDRITITIRADSAELTSTRVSALGALLLEVINNALKHAFPEGMTGMINVSFTASHNQYIMECEDDGIGIDQGQTSDGFGTQNVTDLARLMGGSMTHKSARRSNTRPGTIWRLVMPV